MSHFGFITGFNPFWKFNDLGGQGVDLFFVLSGYLIGNQIFSITSKNESFNIKNFYLRRFLRTLPSYYFVIIIYFLIPKINERQLTVPIWKFFIFTMNYGLHGSGFSHAWSLCVEEHFYILFPLIFLPFLTRFNKKYCFYLLFSILFFSISLRIFSYFEFVGGIGKNYMKFIYYPTHTRLDGLVFGILTSFLRNYYKSLWFKLTQFKWSNLYFVFGVLGLFSAYTLWGVADFEMFNEIFNFTIVAMSCFLLVLSALSQHCFLYKIQIPMATKIATWSYAIYLTHKIFIYLTFKLFSSYFSSYNQSYLCVLFSIVISIAGGWLVYRFVELPFLKLRDIIAPIKSEKVASARE